MAITPDLIRGNTDTIILAHLIHRDSYGYQINKNIQQKTDSHFELKEATLYSAFRRLEQAGCITSYWGDEQSGARRRYYSITPAGVNLFHNNRTEWESAKQLIDRLLEEGEKNEA